MRLDLMQPGLGTDLGQQVASAVLAAAHSAALDQSQISGNAVSYAPPVTQFSCGSDARAPSAR